MRANFPYSSWVRKADPRTGHIDCFLDVPRLSTVQALLLLLKARESAPQRGYFFRSWMSIVTIIAMARDLGLDKHYALHKPGAVCNENPLDCMTRTRVWQACFVYELMICAPQGRFSSLKGWLNKSCTFSSQRDRTRHNAM